MKKGFTLVEIIIVVAIISFLFTIFLVSAGQGEKQFALKRSAHNLSQALTQAQEMAISGQETPADEPFITTTFPKGGYGIYFATDTQIGDCDNAPKGYCIILFADCDDGNDYDEFGFADTNCEEATNTSPSGSVDDEKIREISLEQGISIKEFYPDLDSLVITFFPPDPEITINGYLITESASITITNGKSEKTITINAVGLIDID